MTRAIGCALILAGLAPFAASAQEGPIFSVFAGRELSVSGDVHKGAISPIGDPRSFDAIFGNANSFGIEMGWPMANGEVFGQLRSTRSGAGQIQVGGVYVPALTTTLPV